MQTIELQKAKEYIEKIKKNIPTKITSSLVEQDIINLLKKYNPVIEKFDEETQEKVKRKIYLSSEMKKIIEKFYFIEPKTYNEKTGHPGGIKISKATHHSFSNIPIPTKAVKYTNKIAFFPVEELIHEEEISGIAEEENNKFKIVKAIRLYVNTIKKTNLIAKIMTAKIAKEELNNLQQQFEKPEELLKYCKTYHNRKTIFFKEDLIEDKQTLDEIKIDKETITIINEEGEEETYKITQKREVGKFIFGIGIEKELKIFYAILPINIFLRKDLTEKKENIGKPESITYITNGKRLKVNYKNLFLKSIDLKHPLIFTNVTATNEKDHEFEILLPVFRRKDGKWQDVMQKEIYKALIQVKGTHKIKVKNKDKDTYSIQPKDIPINKPIQLETPKKELNEELVKNQIKEIKEAFVIYRNMQRIKEIVDRIEID